MSLADDYAQATEWNLATLNQRDLKRALAGKLEPSWKYQPTTEA